MYIDIKIREAIIVKLGIGSFVLFLVLKVAKVLTIIIGNYCNLSSACLRSFTA